MYSSDSTDKSNTGKEVQPHVGTPPTRKRTLLPISQKVKHMIEKKRNVRRNVV